MEDRGIYAKDGKVFAGFGAWTIEYTRELAGILEETANDAQKQADEIGRERKHPIATDVIRRHNLDLNDFEALDVTCNKDGSRISMITLNRIKEADEGAEKVEIAQNIRRIEKDIDSTHAMEKLRAINPDDEESLKAWYKEYVNPLPVLKIDDEQAEAEKGKPIPILAPNEAAGNLLVEMLFGERFTLKSVRKSLDAMARLLSLLSQNRIRLAVRSKKQTEAFYWRVIGESHYWEKFWDSNSDVSFVEAILKIKEK